MSLGENLQFLRKQSDITQEQLAEKLEVSRQSVSKWESDTAYPEMDKIMQICELFHVSMDDLVRNDVSALYVDDRTGYDEHMNSFSKMITAGVGLILFGLSLMFLLEGLNMKFLWFCDNVYDVSLGQYVLTAREDVFTGVFLIFVMIAVVFFIVAGLRHGNYAKDNPALPQLYKKEEIKAFRQKFTALIAAGVTIILVDVVILVSVDGLFPEIDEIEYLECFAVSFFFLLITAAVSLLVYAGIQNSKYDIDEWNKMNDKNSVEYKKSEITGTVCGCIMLVATIVYLTVGFCFGEWGIGAPVIYSGAGILCGIVAIIIDHISLDQGNKKKDVYEQKTEDGNGM